MSAERNDADSAHELRLEGIGLVFGGGLLLALLVGAFYVGRWVERRVQLDTPTIGAGVAPLEPVAKQPDADASSGLTIFDTAAGEQQLEPEREHRSAQTKVEPARPVERRPQVVSRTVEDGGFFVQVVAVRDERAAAELIRTLEQQGYGVRLFSEREGQGVLYKVRVGGYSTREEASSARDRLVRGGHAGAFVWNAG